MNLYFGLPQYIYLALIVASIAIDAYNHNKEQTKKTRIEVSIITSIIMILLLFWGGFFTSCNG